MTATIMAMTMMKKDVDNNIKDNICSNEGDIVVNKQKFQKIKNYISVNMYLIGDGLGLVYRT